jgi:ABC-type uncharacterized transport system substrate-binding protein
VNRRGFLRGLVYASATTAAASFAAACGSARILRSSQPAKIGLLSPAVQGAPVEAVAAFKRGLTELGYVEGQNIAIQWAFVGSQDEDRLEKRAVDLARSDVDVIVCTSSQATRAALRASNSIPLVMVTVADPVEAGFVASLQRPGGRVTGLACGTPGLAAARLDLLLQLAPDAWPIAVLYDPSSTGSRQAWQEAESHARALGIQLAQVEVTDQADFFMNRVDHALEDIQPKALLVLGEDTLIDFGINRSTIVRYAVQHRIPGMYFWRKWPAEGGLMSYGPGEEALYRRSAFYVDKLVRGESPDQLPIEQSTTSQFVVNELVLKGLGLTLPATMAEQVTEWVR